MPIRGKVFRSTPRGAVLAQPYIAPAHPGAQWAGIPWGIDLRTGKLVTVDVHRLRQEHIINGLVMRVDGLREAGKSAFMKSMALRLLGSQAGLDERGYPIPLRARIIDQKPEDGDPEYGVLTEALHSQVIKPVKIGKINPFDASMGDEVSLLETSINLTETVLGRALRRFEALAQQVAVHKMYHEYKQDSCPEVLERIFRSLNQADIDRYYKVNDDRLLGEFENRLATDQKLTHQLEALIDRPANIPLDTFQADAAQMAAAMSQLLYGDYGNVFGNGISMRSMLTKPLATIDRTGMNAKVTTIFDALLWRWQTWALDHNDQELIPHLNIGDEEADSYKSLMYLRSYDEFQRKSRAFHTLDMKAVQVSQQLAKAGSEGSEIRELAKSIERGISIRAIFKQPNDDEVLEGLTNLGLSDFDAWFCASPNMKVGCYGLKIGDQPVIFVQHLLTPMELDIVKSNAATTRMMQRTNVYDLPEVRQRVEQLNTAGTENKNVGTH